MRALLLTFIIGLNCDFAEAQTNAWNGLQPLRSTRADVEAKYGKPLDDDRWRVHYANNDEKIDVVYSQKPCDAGWSVPIGTVLRLEVTRSERVGKSFKELGLNKSELSVSVDDAFYALWTQPESGRTFYFDNGDQQLIYEGYIPIRSDNIHRCDGFPPFIPEAINYMRLDEFSLNPRPEREFDNGVLSRLDSFLADRENRNDGKDMGYVVVYFDNKLPLAKYKNRLASIEKHIFLMRKQSRENVNVIEGGYREESKVELYLLPRDWKPPAPDPSLPSPQFTKKRPVKN
jgi:hypothetical protein